MKLFVFDIDNTLVSHYQEESVISTSTKNALRMIEEMGHHCIIATGRTYNTTCHIMKEIDIWDAILCNGSTIVLNNEVTYNKPIVKDCLEDILKEAREKNIATLGFDSHDIYVYDDVVDKEYFNQQIKSFIVPMFQGTNCGIKKFDFSREYNSISFFTKEKIKKFENISVTIYEEGGYEFMNSCTSKATGILKYIEMYNFSKEDVYVFGDNYNDISMFEEFYENSYVLGNACDEVKNHAKYVCDHIDDDGIYNAVVDILEV
ncbi:MAG: Cof-type HAD-IIB family hydrolase [Bacilli bacterium]